MLGEAALALHRMHELAVGGDVEGAGLPGNDLDGREPRAELVHQRPREVERLRLVAAFGAVNDLDLDRFPGHTATLLTSSRSSRCTSALANDTVFSRIFCSSTCSRVRTSSGSRSTGASGDPNSGCAAKIFFRS